LTIGLGVVSNPVIACTSRLSAVDVMADRFSFGVCFLPVVIKPKILNPCFTTDLNITLFLQTLVP
jgi:hypothetical protein